MRIPRSTNERPLCSASGWGYAIQIDSPLSHVIVRTLFHCLFISLNSREHCVREPVIEIPDSDEDGQETA